MDSIGMCTDLTEQNPINVSARAPPFPPPSVTSFTHLRPLKEPQPLKLPLTSLYATPIHTTLLTPCPAPVPVPPTSPCTAQDSASPALHAPPRPSHPRPALHTPAPPFTPPPPHVLVSPLSLRPPGSRQPTETGAWDPPRALLGFAALGHRTDSRAGPAMPGRLGAMGGLGDGGAAPAWQFSVRSAPSPEARLRSDLVLPLRARSPEHVTAGPPSAPS
ncbi:hypothetical protein LEMLEM_LOCUS511 [Lemmus lemmus]